MMAANKSPIQIQICGPLLSLGLALLGATRASLNGVPSSGLSSESEARQTTFTNLKDRLTELRRHSEAKESTPERALARRVLNQFTAASFEESMMLIQARKYDLAASHLAIDAELRPDNWRLLYSLACAYALKGDKRRAIEALNSAVEKGFANVAELERDDQLNAIREEISSSHPRLHRLVTSPAFKRACGEMSGDRLTRVPRGYVKDHPAAHYLQFKQFLGASEYEASFATSPAFYRELLKVFKAVTPLVKFLNQALLERLTQAPILADELSPRDRRRSASLPPTAALMW